MANCIVARARFNQLYDKSQVRVGNKTGHVAGQPYHQRCGATNPCEHPVDAFWFDPGDKKDLIEVTIGTPVSLLT